MTYSEKLRELNDKLSIRSALFKKKGNIVKASVEYLEWHYSHQEQCNFIDFCIKKEIDMNSNFN
jgi:hypothetical protein